MINRKLLDETFSDYDRETVIEILDLFISEFEGRFEKLHRNISERNFPELLLHAHSLKGVISNFSDPECTILATELDLMARNQTVKGLEDVLEELEKNSRLLLKELAAIRDSLIS